MDIKNHFILDGCPTGSFCYDGSVHVKTICNAPKNCNGVYVYSRINNGTEEILYIGASGMLKGDGTHQKERRLWNRIVGKHCGKTSVEFFSKEHLAEKGVEKLYISWWNTGDKIPELVEFMLLFAYFLKHKKLPIWNSEIKASKALMNMDCFYEELNKTIELLKVE